jgi:hypothetical protein
MRTLILIVASLMLLLSIERGVTRALALRRGAFRWRGRRAIQPLVTKETELRQYWWGVGTSGITFAIYAAVGVYLLLEVGR